MSDFLRVDTRVLRNTSEQVIDIQGMFRSVCNGVMAEVEALEPVYTGDAAEAFYAWIHKIWEPWSNDMDALFHNYAAFLHNAALRYELPIDEMGFRVGSQSHETIFAHDH